MRNVLTKSSHRKLNLRSREFQIVIFMAQLGSNCARSAQLRVAAQSRISSIANLHVSRVKKRRLA